MKRQGMAIFVFMSLVLSCGAAAQPVTSTRDLAPDQPGDDEVLNEELWQFAKKTPYSEAMEHVRRSSREAGPSLPAQVELPNGWKIAPAGTQVEVGRFPHEAVPYAGHIVVLNTGYYYKEPQEVSVVDPETGKLVKVLHLESMFPSAVTGLDADLYISGGFSRKVYRFDRRFEAVRQYAVKGYAAGLAPIDAGRIAVLYMVSSDSAQDFEAGRYGRGKLAILNTTSGEIERETDAGYFPHTVRCIDGKLYVSILGEDKVQVYDMQLNILKSIEVGRTPQDLCSDPEHLYVVNTGSDSLSVLGTRDDSLVSTIELKVKGNRYGSGPTSCAVEGNRLYVTQSDVNAVAVLDKGRGTLLGSVPTGWYPTKVLFHKGWMHVLSAKGIRPRRPNIDGPQPYQDKGGSQYVITLLKGSLSIISKKQVSSRLPLWTRQVDDGSPLYAPSKGFELPIRHIFYIVRENRSYDQVLGDLGRGNGDPYLTLFGEEITPNAHRLSREFVTLDKFFANGEISVLGHSFTTSGYASPFLEWLGNTQYSGRYKSYPFGSAPAVTSPSYLWDAMDDKGVDYRIYGENYFLYTRAHRIITETYGVDSGLAKKFYANMMLIASKTDRGGEFYSLAKDFYDQTTTPEDALHLLENNDFALRLSTFLCGDESLSLALKNNAGMRQRFAEYLYRYPLNYRSWDLNHSDLERARVWKNDFEKQIERGKVAQLHYIWLPNDHTGGTDPKYLSPDQLVAQNDAALGFIIETISRSPVWKESLILVTEDDAQNGPDHVDATRTVALAAGPYVKRDALIPDRYDQLSLLRTIETLLGLKPLNMNDALAVPMFSIFTRVPNFEPYKAPIPSPKLRDVDLQLYQELKKK
jgi:hypothetical protein